VGGHRVPARKRVGEVGREVGRGHALRAMGKAKKVKSKAVPGGPSASASAASASAPSPAVRVAAVAGPASRSRAKGPKRPVWRRAWVRDAEWTEDEFKELAFWAKQVLALVAGCAVGAAGVVGGLGNVVFLAAVVLGFFVYSASYLGVDPDDVGGVAAIAGEGILPAYAIFLLVWTGFHTARGAGWLS